MKHTILYCLFKDGNEAQTKVKCCLLPGLVLTHVFLMPHVGDPITQISNEGSVPQACPQNNRIRKSPENPSDISRLSSR